MKYNIFACAITTLIATQAHAIAVGEYNPSAPKVKVCTPGTNTCTYQNTPSEPYLPPNLSPQERASLLARYAKEGYPTAPIKVTLPGTKDPVVVDPISTKPIGKVPLPAPLPVKDPIATTSPVKVVDASQRDPIKVTPTQPVEPIKVGPVVKEPITTPFKPEPIILVHKVEPGTAQPVPVQPTSTTAKTPVATTINGTPSTPVKAGSTPDPKVASSATVDRLNSEIRSLDYNYINTTYALMNQSYNPHLSAQQKADLAKKIAQAKSDYVKGRTNLTEQIKTYQTPAQKNVTDIVQAASTAQATNTPVSAAMASSQEMLFGQMRSGNGNALQTAKEMVPALQQALAQARLESANKAQAGGLKNVDQTKQVALEYALGRLQTEIKQTEARRAAVIDMPISLTPQTR